MIPFSFNRKWYLWPKISPFWLNFGRRGKQHIQNKFQPHAYEWPSLVFTLVLGVFMLILGLLTLNLRRFTLILGVLIYCSPLGQDQLQETSLKILTCIRSFIIEKSCDHSQQSHQWLICIQNWLCETFYLSNILNLKIKTRIWNSKIW